MLTTRVLQLTDSHLQGRSPVLPPREFGDAVHLLTGRTTHDAAVAVCEAVAKTGPIDLVLHTGDITDDQSLESYEAASDLVGSFGAPVLVTPGNHDLPSLVQKVFPSVTAKTTSHLDIGGWRIILASSLHEQHHSGTFTDDTLRELEKLLDFGGPVLIGTHHPALSPCCHPDCINARSAEFLALIDQYANVVTVVAGHLHLCDEIVRRGVRHLVSPSTALQLKHVHPLPENNHVPTQGGARILDLRSDGSLATRLIWA